MSSKKTDLGVGKMSSDREDFPGRSMGAVTASSRQGDKQRRRRTVDGYLEAIEKPTPAEFKTYYNDRYFGAPDGRVQYTRGYTAGEIKHMLLDDADAGVGRNLAAYAVIVDRFR